MANTGNHDGFSGSVTCNAVALNVTKSEPTGEDAFGSHQKNDGEKLVTCEVSYFIIIHVSPVRQLFVI